MSPRTRPPLVMAAAVLAIVAGACASAPRTTPDETAPPAPEPGIDAALSSLVASERAFAAASVESGVRHSFLQFLAEGAVLFRPGPVDGRQWMESRPEPQARLRWAPASAEVSRAGDMGVTSGPWEYSVPVTGDDPSSGWRVSGTGSFATIWRRQPDGGWRVEVDMGLDHPPLPLEGEVALRGPAAAGRAARAPEDGKISLRQAEEGYTWLAASEGVVAALREHAAPDLRLFRAGVLPATSRAAALTEAGDAPLHLREEVLHLEVAASQDLGYTYGRATPHGTASPSGAGFHFLRAWRREPGGRWRVALEMLARDPAPAPAPGA